jgi:hypothetical protein
MSARRLEPSAGSALVERGCGGRRAALAALRSSLAGLGTYVVLSSLSYSAAAADIDIQAVYEVTFAGLAVANANLSFAVRGSSYTARINYRTSGAARLMSSATGEAVSRGAYKSGRLMPATFDLDHRGGQRVQKVALVMTGGAVKVMTLDPPVDPKSDRVPIEVEHLKNIVDPVSAILISAVGTDGKTEIRVCDRSLPIFDGLRRYNIELDQKATGISSRGAFLGQVTTCQLRWTPLAGGVRSDNGTLPTSRNGELGEITMTFGLVNAVNVYVPVSASAKIGYGALEVRLAQFSSSGAKN